MNLLIRIFVLIVSLANFIIELSFFALFSTMLIHKAEMNFFFASILGTATWFLTSLIPFVSLGIKLTLPWINAYIYDAYEADWSNFINIAWIIAYPCRLLLIPLGMFNKVVSISSIQEQQKNNKEGY